VRIATEALISTIAVRTNSLDKQFLPCWSLAHSTTPSNVIHEERRIVSKSIPTMMRFRIFGPGTIRISCTGLFFGHGPYGNQHFFSINVFGFKKGLYFWLHFFLISSLHPQYDLQHVRLPPRHSIRKEKRTCRTHQGQSAEAK